MRCPSSEFAGLISLLLLNILIAVLPLPPIWAHQLLSSNPANQQPMPILAVLLPPPPKFYQKTKTTTTTRRPIGRWKSQLVVDNSVGESSTSSTAFSSTSSAWTSEMEETEEWTSAASTSQPQSWLVSQETGSGSGEGNDGGWKDGRRRGKWRKVGARPLMNNNIANGTTASNALGQCLLQCVQTKTTTKTRSTTKTTKTTTTTTTARPTTMNDSSSSEEEAEPSSQHRGCLGKGTRTPAGKGKAIWAGCANAKKATTTTAEPFYYEYEAAEDLTQFGRCNVSVITDQAQRIVINLLFYTAAAWVPFWAFLAIAVNISFRQFGHHRWLDFYQELGFILLFPFMGVFVLMPQLELLCLITTMVLLFFLVFILVIGFLQAYFASSLIKGTSLKDGRLPVAVNYVWPLALAAVPVGVSMWLLRSDIGTNRVHCFAPIYSNLFWAFVVPAWLLWWLMLIRNQLSITACKQSRPNVDRVQLYWARKSVKGTPILLCWFLLTFFTQLFAVDMQLLWLCVLFTAESLVLGPLLFLLHTHNHQRVNNGIFERTQMGLYRPCPVRRQPVATGPGLPPPPPPPPPPAQTTTLGPPEIIQQTVVPSPAVPLSAPAPRPQTLVQTVQLPPVGQPTSAPIPQGQQTAKKPTEKSKTAAEPGTTEAGGGGGEANAQLFYEWLTDTDERNLQESERVLWPPRPV